MSKLPVLFAIPLVLVLSGCQSNLSGSTYARDEARSIQRVQFGVVEDVRMVQLEGTRSGVGTATGAAVGGLAGSTVGNGRGRDIVTVVGAVAGGLVGSAVEEGATRSQGVELVIQLEKSGKLIAVVQAFDPAEQFHPGDRVRVMTIRGTTRVSQ